MSPYRSRVANPAFGSFSLCFSAVDVPPRLAAPSTAKTERRRPAPVWRGARQDAEASIVRPGMACRWTPLRLRSAGDRIIACDDSAQTQGRRFFGYFLGAVAKKVTRQQGGSALATSALISRAPARTPKLQGERLVPRYTRSAGTRDERSSALCTYEKPLPGNCSMRCPTSGIHALPYPSLPVKQRGHAASGRGEKQAARPSQEKAQRPPGPPARQAPKPCTRTRSAPSWHNSRPKIPSTARSPE